jgi:hypothetical protein
MLVTQNVISSNCKCGPKEFLYGKNNARLFDPNNSIDISLKIEKYLNSKKMDTDELKNKITLENLINLN